jgi:hypothetical protein
LRVFRDFESDSSNSGGSRFHGGHRARHGEQGFDCSGARLILTAPLQEVYPGIGTLQQMLEIN